MEEVYRKTLEIIMELCGNYATTTSQIESICMVVLELNEGK